LPEIANFIGRPATTTTMRRNLIRLFLILPLPACSSLILKVDKPDIPYDDFNKLTNDFLVNSYRYLFLSAQFGTFQKDRPGFEKVFHGLSDGAWNKGIEMIKEVTKRGSSHDFSSLTPNTRSAPKIASKVDGELSESAAMALAAEIEKELLITANDVHRHHSHAVKSDSSKNSKYDAGLAHYLEEEIIEDKSETVRTLVGHVNDLNKLWATGKTEQYPLSLHLFDQYLQK